MARRKKNTSCLGACFELAIGLCLLPFTLIFACVKDFKPMNSKGRKISNKNKKRWL